MQVLGRLGLIVVQRFMAIIVKVAMTISQNLCVQHTWPMARSLVACDLRHFVRISCRRESPQ